jgi:hypothetical protein
VDELHTDLTGPVLIDVREADEWKGGKVRLNSHLFYRYSLTLFFFSFQGQFAFLVVLSN